MPVLFGHVDDERLDEIATDAQRLPVSYDEVGWTRRSSWPKGYRVDRYSTDLGPSGVAFDRGVEGLRRWQPHRGAGVRVAPNSAKVEADVTVVVAIGIAFLTAVAPCRIVYVIDEPDRFGFAYGTLVGHPERGEEMFVITRTGDRVMFEVAAFSRPTNRLARLGSPIARSIQTTTTKRYLTALKSFVDSS